MILRLDPDSHVPPYEQIRSQIATMAASGVLPQGSRLPSIRQLAADLDVAGGTVARAYRELEQDGVVSTHGRHGTIVEDVQPPSTAAEELYGAATSYASRALQLGVDPTEAVESVQRAFHEIADAASR